MTMSEAGIVTVVVPVRDEASTVSRALESLATQSIRPERIEVLVYDGRSRDGTADICRAFADRAPWHRFRVEDSPQRTVPHALNAGLAKASGEWFTRLDGRTSLSPSYLAECVTMAASGGPGTAAGGRLEAEAIGATAESIAAVVTHPLGVGQGFRTRVVKPTEVPHHPFAVWRTADVRAFGGYRAQLTRNQDDEFSMRARAAGARIWVLPTATVRYRPRERVRGVATQYFQYGLWKAAVGRSEGLFPLQSLAPALVTVCAVGAAAAARRSPLPLAGGALLYATAAAAVRRSRPGARLVPTTVALLATHMSYGLGLLIGVARPSLTTSVMGHGRLR